MPVIDTHTHFFPQEWIDLLESEGQAHGVTLGRNDSGAITFAGPGIRQVFAKPFIDLGVRRTPEALRRHGDIADAGRRTRATGT